MAGTDKISIITKRDIDRKLDIEKRKESQNLASAENEQIEFFENTFASHHLNILQSIEDSLNTKTEVLPSYFNEIAIDILKLQKYVASSNIFLRSYDIKKYQEILNELTNKAKIFEEKLIPKKKFGFKKKPRNAKKLIEKTKDEVDFLTPKIRDKFEYEIVGFANEKDADLALQSSAIHNKHVNCERLENCSLKLFGNASTLHLNDLVNCQVATGPVSTSIFATNCVNCTLHIACQQLRLHSSKNLKINLHVTSRAILEDCKNIEFAPYGLEYSGIEEDFNNSGLDRSVNNWQSIDDFNWLNAEKPSPNWCIKNGTDERV